MVLETSDQTLKNVACFIHRVVTWLHGCVRG